MSNLEPSATDEFTPIESQDELNRIITSRVARERAKYADYDELKAAAEGVDTLKAEHASAVEKLKGEHASALEAVAAEKAAADAEVERLTGELLKHTVASEKGVPAKLLTGSTKEELEAAADALLDFKRSGTARGNAGMFGLDSADMFATRDAEARQILGL